MYIKRITYSTFVMFLLCGVAISRNITHKKLIWLTVEEILEFVANLNVGRNIVV